MSAREPREPAQLAVAALEIDPATETWDIFDELVGAYTYSDRTGNALSLVAGGIVG